MNEEKAREIAVCILEEVERLLASKGIKVPLEDREGGEEETCLYGAEYYGLEDSIVYPPSRPPRLGNAPPPAGR
jgi:hypothetical protein